ncbi:MAG TPA: dihydrodipicolinate synthase family protein [Longimicrobiaceae bacterium]
MDREQWSGVMPAITTPFKEDGSVDLAFIQEHAQRLVGAGCTGVVALGSLGEANTLTFEEKVAIVRALRDALDRSVPVVAGIAGLATQECVQLAQAAREAGADGLMVLPPYVYRGDWRETEAHFSAVLQATPLSCMLYNNPIAYGTDVVAPQIAQLAREHRNLHAVKESGGDVRRVSAIRELLGDEIRIFVGIDDLIVESVAVGATGWIAGLVNALPEESVRLFNLAISGDRERALQLYDWFLPLLRFDTVPKFVQLIKLVQRAVGLGSERVRPPRLPLVGEELAAAEKLIEERLGHPARAAAA